MVVEPGSTSHHFMFGDELNMCMHVKGTLTAFVLADSYVESNMIPFLYLFLILVLSITHIYQIRFFFSLLFSFVSQSTNTHTSIIYYSQLIKFQNIYFTTYVSFSLSRSVRKIPIPTGIMVLCETKRELQ